MSAALEYNDPVAHLAEVFHTVADQNDSGTLPLEVLDHFDDLAGLVRSHFVLRTQGYSQRCDREQQYRRCRTTALTAIGIMYDALGMTYSIRRLRVLNLLCGD